MREFNNLSQNQEIAGYRKVLDLVHENYEYIEFSKNDIFALHYYINFDILLVDILVYK